MEPVRDLSMDVFQQPPNDMPRVFSSSASKKSICVTRTQLTPPSSPDFTHYTDPKIPAGPKKPCSKLLRKVRCTKSIIYRDCNGRSSIKLHKLQSTQSLASKMDTCPTSTLPASPPSTDIDSANSSQYSLSPRFELRRISSSFHNLRAVAQEQIHFGSSLHSPLLPSPVIDDRRINAKHRSQQSYLPRLPTEQPHSRQVSNYNSYEDLHILSLYENNPGTGFASPSSFYLESQEDDDQTTDVQQSDCSSSPGSSPNPSTPVGTGFRSRLGSSESDWLANTMSHRERVRRFNARCFQVVQHPRRFEAPFHKDEHEIMLATVLVGPGKPKLVQIQRPPSPSNSAGSKDTLAKIERSLDIPPCTPERKDPEISAFSPYDTPCDTTPFTDISTLACRNSPPAIDDLVLSPMTHLKKMSSPRSIFSRRPSTKSDDTELPSSERYTQTFVDPVGYSVLSHSDRKLRRLELPRSRTTPAIWPIRSRTTTTVSQSSQKKQAVSWSYFSQIERAVKAINEAIDSFPNCLLRLDSPTMFHFRNSCNNVNLDKCLLDSLGKVFPSAPVLLLSSLGAWLIVDQFFTTLLASDPLKRLFESEVVRGPSYNLPLRSSQSHTTLLSRSASRGNILTRGETRETQVKTSVLVAGIAAHSNDGLHSIPPKARDILGIRGHYVQPSEDLLMERARDAQKRARIVGSKVLGALIAPLEQKDAFTSLQDQDQDHTWVEELWRSLGVVIELVGMSSTVISDEPKNSRCECCGRSSNNHWL